MQSLLCMLYVVFSDHQAWDTSQAIATNREMQEVTATQWLQKHPRPGMRELVVGLEGEPFWLIAEVT